MEEFFFVALERQGRKTFAFFLTFTISESEKKPFRPENWVLLKRGGLCETRRHLGFFQTATVGIAYHF